MNTEVPIIGLNFREPEPISKSIRDDSGLMMSNSQNRILLFCILVVAAFLQIYRIGAPPLWLDEALSYSRSQMPVAEIIKAAYHWDVHPATYYVLLHFWKTLGNSEAILRMLSVIFSFFSLPVLFSFCGKIRNRQFALAATFFLSVSLLHVRYAQEVRSYALYFLISLFVYFHFYLALQSGKPKHWYFWAAASILNLYIHYFALFLFVTQLIWLVLSLLISGESRKRIHWKAALPAVVLIGIAFIPQLLFFVKQAGTKVSTDSEIWRAANPLQFGLIYLKTFVCPISLTSGILDKGLKYAVLLILGIGNILAWPRYRDDILFHGFQFVAVGLLTWMASFFVVIPAPFKYVIFANISFVMLCTLSLLGILNRIEKISFLKRYSIVIYAFISLGFVLTITRLYWDYYQMPRAEDWMSGVETVQSQYRESDQVVAIPDYSDYQFKYYAAKQNFQAPVTRMKQETLKELQDFLKNAERTFVLSIGSTQEEMSRINVFLKENGSLIWQDDHFPNTKIWLIQRRDLNSHPARAG